MSKIGGDALTDGASVNQWELTGNDTQKWIFTHDGYGYYTIHQVNGSQLLCMNVENNSTALNEDIVLSYEGIFYFNDPTLWKISITESGGFRLTPKHGEDLDYALATSTSSQTNGAKLIQGAYVDNNSYRDEWILEGQQSLTIIHYYDHAFVERYTNKEEALRVIRESQAFASEKLENIYGLNIIEVFVPATYTSLADTCQIDERANNTFNIDAPVCNCNNASGSCLTRNNLRSQWINDIGSGTNKISVVLWTGHRLDGNPPSGSQSSSHSIVMTPCKTHLKKASGAVEFVGLRNAITTNSNTLLHELSHQLGAPDDYCDDRSNAANCNNKGCHLHVYGNTNPTACVMNADPADYLRTDEDLYCDNCYNIITAHIADHH